MKCCLYICSTYLFVFSSEISPEHISLRKEKNHLLNQNHFPIYARHVQRNK